MSIEQQPDSSSPVSQTDVREIRAYLDSIDNFEKLDLFIDSLKPRCEKISPSEPAILSPKAQELGCMADAAVEELGEIGPEDFTTLDFLRQAYSGQSDNSNATAGKEDNGSVRNSFFPEDEDESDLI